MKKLFLNLLLVVCMLFSMSVCCSAGTLDISGTVNDQAVGRIPAHPDYMAIREIHVWARYTNDSTGKEYWSTKEEDSCFIEKYSSSSEFVGLKVTPEERKTKLDKKLTGYTQVGYHIEIKYQILGDEPFNQRKIVTQEPENTPKITFLPNGDYVFKGNSTLQDPDFIWSGLFYRRDTYSSQFMASVTFAQ